MYEEFEKDTYYLKDHKTMKLKEKYEFCKSFTGKEESKRAPKRAALTHALQWFYGLEKLTMGIILDFACGKYCPTFSLFVGHLLS